eukprot:gnl/TRDRNA2_/TRDRNA2_168224_c1_seq1.p1 gnl/TRDRNA2_/TRDRNA2_168224_c1~~gnl/TRDRNA2_/TRDRNA2_168224_c1_seq1.p1  ORF type:complete len:118 (+),score=11.91 gnl/TRDRNA2_/TRDRNA2_168224_c1_seq1:121-474(+)
MSRRGLDTDGNGGVVLEKIGEILLSCANAEVAAGAEAKVIRALLIRARDILKRASSLLEAVTSSGEANLRTLCDVCTMQISFAESWLDRCTSEPIHIGNCVSLGLLQNKKYNGGFQA